jgi:hypothetical protein
MRKVLSVVFTVALVLGFSAPAQSAPPKYTAYQKTLSAFSSGVTSLTSQQRAQVEEAVQANPNAEKFVCTGIRYVAQPQSANIEIRKRAKAACDYAKALNPGLSTWVQSKPTQAMSFAGKVLLTVKSPTAENAYYATFANYCDVDKSPGKGFEALETAAQKLMRCGSPTRIVNVPMPVQAPDTQITPTSSLLNPLQCKLQNGPSAWSAALGFPRPDQKHFSLNPGPDTTYQILPIFADDAPSKGSNPAADYGHYFKILEEWSRFNSDWAPTAEVRVPDEYVSLGGDLADFKITHGNPNQPNKIAFMNKVIDLFDDQIDFTDVDYILFVVPPATPRDIVDQSPMLNATTKERSGIDAVVLPGIPLNAKSISSDHPLSWMHGFVHGAVDFDDHYGDERVDAGMGHWGIMTRVKTDWLALEKWQLGHIRDSQVRCADGTQSSTHWLAPSQIKTTKEKLLMIPTGPYTAIVVESVRAVGFNYRLPERSEGALVYTIDTNSAKHGFGYKVVTDQPTNFRTSFIFDDAPLKVGESVTVGKITITLIEAGKWGDVVQVGPAS